MRIYTVPSVQTVLLATSVVIALPFEHGKGTSATHFSANRLDADSSAFLQHRSPRVPVIIPKVIPAPKIPVPAPKPPPPAPKVPTTGENGNPKPVSGSCVGAACIAPYGPDIAGAGANAAGALGDGGGEGSYDPTPLYTPAPHPSTATSPYWTDDGYTGAVMGYGNNPYAPYTGAPTPASTAYYLSPYTSSSNVPYADPWFNGSPSTSARASTPTSTMVITYSNGEKRLRLTRWAATASCLTSFYLVLLS